MDLMKKFFIAKGVDVEKNIFTVLDGTNTMSGRNMVYNDKFKMSHHIISILIAATIS